MWETTARAEPEGPAGWKHKPGRTQGMYFNGNFKTQGKNLN